MTSPAKPRAVHIKRDGQLLATVPHADAAFIWMVRNTNFSIAYAIKYNGYSVTYADNGKPPPSFGPEAFANYVVASKAGR